MSSNATFFYSYTVLCLQVMLTDMSCAAPRPNSEPSCMYVLMVVAPPRMYMLCTQVCIRVCFKWLSSCTTHPSCIVALHFCIPPVPSSLFLSQASPYYMPNINAAPACPSTTHCLPNGGTAGGTMGSTMGSTSAARKALAESLSLEQTLQLWIRVIDLFLEVHECVCVHACNVLQGI